MVPLCLLTPAMPQAQAQAQGINTTLTCSDVGLNLWPLHDEPVQVLVVQDQDLDVPLGPHAGLPGGRPALVVHLHLADEGARAPGGQQGSAAAGIVPADRSAEQSDNLSLQSQV